MLFTEKSSVILYFNNTLKGARIRYQREPNEQMHDSLEGELINKRGTLVDDIIVPSISRILHQVVGCAEEEIMRTEVYSYYRHPQQRNLVRHFDAVAVCRNAVLLIETQIILESRDIEEFGAFLPKAREFFPKYYSTYDFIGALASLSIDSSLVPYAEKQGLLILGLGEHLADVLNAPDFVPRKF